MNEIEFSHEYYKLQYQGTEAILISAIPYKIDENTPQVFINYDTYYYPDGHYPLEPGDYVLLLFLGDCGVFTTLRTRYKNSEDRLEYYKLHLNEKFLIRRT